MNEIVLRPYQQDFIDNVRKVMLQGKKRICGVAPCGAGKTIMTGWMIKEAEQRGKRSIFFVHRKELIEQTAAVFTRLNIPHGIISAGFKEHLHLPVQIASVQTLTNRLSKIPPPDFLICDECHHILANSYKKIINTWKDAFLLGVTATPERRGGVRLGDIFEALVEAPPVDQLINLGNLTPFNYFAPKFENLDLDHVKVKYGEFDQDDLQSKLRSVTIVGNIVEHYQKLAAGKSAICYCVNVNHSKLVADTFRDAGIAAAHCDGETPLLLREKIIRDFRRGLIKVLCNAELFGEGFDVPNMDAVILARPTLSLTLFVQQSMRAMRPDPNNPNKVAIIIDHVGNCERFGLPDEPRHWSLLPNKNKAEKDKPKLKSCPKCGNQVRIAAKFCPCCNFKFPSVQLDLFNVNQDLQPVFSDFSNKEKNYEPISYRPTTIEAFLDAAKNFGYKPYWAVMKALEHVKSYADCRHIADVMGYKAGWAWHKWNEISNSEKEAINFS